MNYYYIDKTRLIELLKEENQLKALKCAGVDNWQGYYEAKDSYTDGRDISYEDMALEDLKNEFECKEIGFGEIPGITLSMLDLKDGDTIVVTMNMDIWDVNAAIAMRDILVKNFPNQFVAVTCKGLELSKKERNNERSKKN